MRQVLSTGVIRSPHGVKGFVKVHPYSDDFDHFFSLKEVTVQRGDKTRRLEVEKVQEHSYELLMKFKGMLLHLLDSKSSGFIPFLDGNFFQ